MPSQDKLIKQGIQYTDSLFDEISKRLEQGVRASDTLEAFLSKYNKAFPNNGNPLITLDYDKQMLDLILSETNNHKFSRPAQKEMVRVTIENQVGELIKDVGDDIRESVRDIVKDGYDNNLSQDEIAENISNRVSAIKGRRARAIARTEIARTATISDYVINAERGATHFYVECRNTACPVCKANWLKNPDKEATGKGLMGDKTYSMSDTAMLPPIHPNCRCVPYFINPEDDGTGVSKKKPKPEKEPTETLPEPTRDQLYKNLTKKELEEFKSIKQTMQHAKDVQDSEYVTDAGKKNALKRAKELTPRYEELKKKALGLTPKTTRSKKTTTKKKSKKKEKPVVEVNKPKNARLTKEECDSLTFEQLAEHHNANYKGLVKIEDDNNKEYHVFEQTFDNGETFTLHFEKSAVNSYNKEGVATANEIIHEVFKVPELFRKETNQIWFRNTQKGIMPNKRGTGFSSFGKDEGGHNISKNRNRWKLNQKLGRGDNYNDPDHKIAINPKHFKKLKEFLDILNWRDQPKDKTSWKHAIHHEFTHSIDTSREIWRNDKERLSSRDEYLEIENAEPDFTPYAHGQISEAYAEHGGYISYMLANPEEQSKKIKILTYERDEKGRQTSFKPVQEEIDFEEYKQRYPKHYKYFIKLLNGEIKP